MWDPRCKIKGERRQALIQPAIDLGPTLLECFGMEPTANMLGKPLRQTIANDTPVRDAAIFGIHGGHVNVTDGRYVYMRGPAGQENAPIYQYTIMPTHMKAPFSVKELRTSQFAEPFSFTKGCPVMRIGHGHARMGKSTEMFPTLLFDLQEDPYQERPIKDAKVERQMTDHLVRLMREADAPADQYERLGVLEPAGVA